MSASDVGWYCIRCQNKHEHIAAAKLRELGEIEVFNPRVKARKVTRRGPVWFTESLFPTYLFAKFDLNGKLGAIRVCSGVIDVLNFGGRYPQIPESVMFELQETMGNSDVYVQVVELEPGSEVVLSQGPFQGLSAVVKQVMAAGQRVRILLEFLGRQTEFEVRSSELVPAYEHLLSH
ncbi:MAG: transcription termination/antitermination NusG family protein [Verrucomicrobiota bacterium]|nr:transcription termination/antitermination NusG family protein [Verrucomicrobiota bacterium]